VGFLGIISGTFLRRTGISLIGGRIRNRTWKDSSGNQRYRTEIIGERIQLGPRTAGKVAPAEGEARQGRPPAQKEKEEPPKEDIPVIEEEEIDVKDIPF